ncbi:MULTISPECIES: hypothetical protein [Planococcus]|uniref:hypothetical protein n=1 Tax=Planococcus TaxID=1372 RepID=UPI001F3A5015|nr:hypothetical protein [Planococcus soli]
MENVSYEVIKDVLSNFLVDLLIHKISIGEDRKIESIQLMLNDEILKALNIEADNLSNDELSASFSILIAI